MGEEKEKPKKNTTVKLGLNIWSKGLEKNSKWIDSRTYASTGNLSRIPFIEPMLTNWLDKDTIMTYSINMNKQTEDALDGLCYEILCRIGASRSLTATQLLRFLLLQGYIITPDTLDDTLTKLQKNGHINRFVIRDTETRTESVCLSLRKKGYKVCRSLDVEAGEREWISKVAIGDEMSFLIRNIIVNQIILSLLEKGNGKFLFSRAATYILKGVKTHHFPLAIHLNGYDYYFEVAKGGDLETKYIRNAFDNLFKSISPKERTRFIFICDSPAKMGALSMYFFKYLGKDISSRIYYSYIDEWNRDEIGSIYEYVTIESMKRQNIFELE